MAQLGLINVTHYISNELEILCKHLNLTVKNLVETYPDQYPYEGNFKYNLTLHHYDRTTPHPYVFLMEFNYEYKGNIVYPITYDIRKSFYISDEQLNFHKEAFNRICYTMLVTFNIKNIIKGKERLSCNPNHFLYNLTYEDTLKMKSTRQGCLFTD